ncbi:PIR protein [Plasmodium malariae]|uniref:PIR protein n=1 Tax=Plasmodium malariae TaxID=5858 RepID=A0A1D3JI51_PLAMA|nr:PIR protein [Plasmodium malariae]SBT86140.1 PIR protein [Plasmodium malariae]
MEEQIYDEILEKLPSKTIYDEFNSQGNYVIMNSVCKREDYEQCDDIDTCLNICKRIEKNFKSLYEMSNSGNYKERCSHYIYWVYKEIQNLFKSDSTKDKVETVVNAFLKLQSSLTRNYRVYNCSYNFKEKDLNELKDKNKEKQLYDYFTNYDSIKTKDICNKFELNKYKKYLNAINVLYDEKKENCCNSKILVCPNYFLKCREDFKPSKLLSALELSNDHSCNVLEDFKETKTSEKKLESSDFETGFLEQILFTNCHIKNTSTTLSCGLVSAYSLTRRSGNAVENNEQLRNSDISSPKDKKRESIIDLEVEKEHEKIRKIVGLSSEVVNYPSLPKTASYMDIRWKLDKDGKLHCPAENPEKDTSVLCMYVEELVKRGILIKDENSRIYRLKKDKTWATKPLNIVIKRERGKYSIQSYSERLQVLKADQIMVTDDRNSISQEHYGKDNESNILQNIFFRVGTAISLFTPFGSCVDKNRKRKKRHKTNFVELNTKRLSRRFIKRTYRNSGRRRFSVVNIE